MQWKGTFPITAQDPQHSRFETRKYRKLCLTCNDKSNFTTIHRAALVWFLLISSAHGIV